MQRLYRANTTATDGLYPTMWTTFTGEPLNSTLRLRSPSRFIFSFSRNEELK